MEDDIDVIHRLGDGSRIPDIAHCDPDIDANRLKRLPDAASRGVGSDEDTDLTGRLLSEERKEIDSERPRATGNQSDPARECRHDAAATARYGLRPPAAGQRMCETRSSSPPFQLMRMSAMRSAACPSPNGLCAFAMRS